MLSRIHGGEVMVRGNAYIYVTILNMDTKFSGKKKSLKISV